MAFPVTVYSGHPEDGAAVIKVITTESLDERSTAMFAGESNSSYGKANAPDLFPCIECGRDFWQVKGNQKHCGRACSNRASDRRRRDKKRQLLKEDS